MKSHQIVVFSYLLYARLYVFDPGSATYQPVWQIIEPPKSLTFFMDMHWTTLMKLSELNEIKVINLEPTLPLDFFPCEIINVITVKAHYLRILLLPPGASWSVHHTWVCCFQPLELYLNSCCFVLRRLLWNSGHPRVPVLLPLYSDCKTSGRIWDLFLFFSLLKFYFNHLVLVMTSAPLNLHHVFHPSPCPPSLW